MAGAFLAVGASISAVTKNQVIAFVVTAALVFVLTVAGSPIVLGVFQGWAPEWLLHGVAQASFLGHFSAITRGVIDLRDVVYFLSIMIAFLAANAILIDLEKAE
jgi:ABC-2 type transport system permease protein